MITGEDAIGQSRDVLDDRLAVHRLDGERLEDEHLEGAFEELVLLRRGRWRHSRLRDER